MISGYTIATQASKLPSKAELAGIKQADIIQWLERQGGIG
jgi:hypothetical protein